MALVMTPIYTQSGTGSSGSVTFNNIPQIYTDLCVVVSTRSTRTGATTDDFYVNFNGANSSSTSFSTTVLWGNGSSTGSARGSNTWLIGLSVQPAADGTANTFSNGSIYIPNYTSSNSKQFLIDSVNENNTSTIGVGSGLNLAAGLFSSSSAVSSITFYCGYANFTSTSTFSLYGIIRSGA